jgi:4-hydroxy-tetrahydrodipicolinate reductase
VALIVVLGARGRLGALAVAAARDAGHDARAIARGDALDVRGAAAVIDVCTAGSTVLHAQACIEAKVPLVVGTTGMSADDTRALDDAARAIPVIVAANLSVSAHVAAHIAREAAGRLPSYDAEVVEIHHNKKKDAPSGTALMLARAVADARKQDASVFKRARDGHAPRVQGEIGVSAVRGGDVVGEHTVFLLGNGERIEIVHRITDRAVFARGAVAAALFLQGKSAGKYTMADVY